MSSKRKLVPPLEWKRARRNSTGNMVWETRCGYYRVEESARYKDIEFPSVYYTAWSLDLRDNPNWKKLSVAVKKSSKTKHVPDHYRFKFFSKNTAMNCCQAHAKTPVRKVKSG